MGKIIGPDVDAISAVRAEFAQQRRRRQQQEREEKREARRRYYLQWRGADTTGFDYQAMYEAQHGRCRICGRRERAKIARGRRRRIRALSADHDHRSRKIRGLLCRNCNHGLGYFRHDPQLLRRAATYLSSYISRRAKSS